MRPYLTKIMTRYSGKSKNTWRKKRKKKKEKRKKLMNENIGWG